MAFGNYSRVDARKSRSPCSTVSVVVFVAFLLVGIWVFMSSAVEDQELPSEDPVSEARRHHAGTAKQFEDVSGDARMPEEVQLDEASTRGGGDEPGESAASEEDRNGNPSEEEQSKMSESESERAEPEEREESVAETKETSLEQNDEKESGAASELPEESKAEGGGAWATQAAESRNEKKMQRKSQSSQAWKLCNVTAGPDYIPCLDNWGAIRQLRSTKHYEHRERHCPEDPPTCLVSLPEGYKRSVKWPTSRDKIWYSNVPHIKLAKVKGHQNWVKESGEYLTFPGGGTQFKHGALHYIDFIQTTLSDIAWGKRSRVVLDIGCGVASFGGYLFDRDVLAVSLAPKDEHEAQVQFALERGIPAISAVMGTKRLPFPGGVFDVVHCARCRVPWHIEGGKLLLELDRLLRPGGHFVWSATPVYQSLPEDVKIWEDMTKLTKSMCWEMVAMKKDKLNEVAAAVFRKPTSNECYSDRPENDPPLCSDSDEPNASWNVPLEACVHKVTEGSSERGSKWPAQWPLRLEKPPYWLKSQVGVYKKSAFEDFSADYKRWKKVFSESYLEGIGINWSSIRNVMDMRAIYGGFAAALRDMKVWVMNVVPIDSPDTLPVIYERGLIGIYHDWCESFSTYPRTYDLLHADHLFSAIRNRCKLRAVIAEVDRILRPQGSLIVRDDAETVSEIESMAKSLKWDVKYSFSDEKEGWLHVQKSFWRPKESETILSAVA